MGPQTLDFSLGVLTVPTTVIQARSATLTSDATVRSLAAASTTTSAFKAPAPVPPPGALRSTARELLATNASLVALGVSAAALVGRVCVYHLDHCPAGVHATIRVSLRPVPYLLALELARASVPNLVIILVVMIPTPFALRK